MEAGKVVRNRMQECEKLFKGKWKMYLWMLPKNGKKIKKYERIPTETTYLIPLERVETATAYNPRIHDPRYAGTSENTLSEAEPLHDDSFKAGASFFAQINAGFGKPGRSIPSELEVTKADDEECGTSAKSCHKEKSQMKEKSSGSNKKDNDDEVMVIEDLEETTINNAGNSSSKEIQILQDDSHLPIMDSKDDSPPGKLIRRPSLNIVSDNSIQMIFHKTNQIHLEKQKKTEICHSTSEKNKELVTSTKKNPNPSKENSKDLNKITIVNVSEKLSEKITTKIPTDNSIKENALARLALDYDVDDITANESVIIDNHNYKERNNENPQKGITTTSNSKSFEIKNPEYRINSSSTEEVVQNSLTKQTKTTENVNGKIIRDAEIDPDPRETISTFAEKEINENSDSGIVARKSTISENSEKEKGEENEENDRAIRNTETNDEQRVSVSLTTSSNEIMTFHKSSDTAEEVKTTKKVARPKRVYKIRKNASRKSKFTKEIFSKTSELMGENNSCPTTLRALIEAEVEALMKTEIMKEIQRSVVNKLLLDKEMGINLPRKSPIQSQGNHSPNENSLVSSQGLFSPSLFPVEEVSTDLGNQNPSIISPLVVQNQIPSCCTQHCSSCKNQQENNIISNSPSPILNNFSPQLNLGALSSPVIDGLFYSDIQLLKSRITYDEVDNFAKNFPPAESVPNKPSRKRKSNENNGGKAKKSKDKKQIENGRKSSGPKTMSALQLVGLEKSVQEGYTDLYTNNHRTNSLNISPPDLNCQLSIPSILPPAQNYHNTFPSQRNTTEMPETFPTRNIRGENPPNAVFHYYPPRQSQNASSGSPILPPLPNSLPPPMPPPPCVQMVKTSFNSRQQMQYEQISPSPPMNINPNADLNHSFENPMLFLSPGDHQQYLSIQQSSRTHDNANQHLQQLRGTQLQSSYNMQDIYQT